MLLASLGTSIANVALPTLAESFDASFQQVQWVVLAYLLTITALIVGAGRAGDLVGRRRLLLAGIGLFTLASLLCGSAPSLGWLIGGRAVQGAGAAIMMALSLAFVAGTVPRERIGGAMGLMGTMSAIGTALGPSLGGLLIAGLGWRSTFFVAVPSGLAALLLAARFLPQDPQAEGPHPVGFDWAGMTLLASALAAYALAMTIGDGRFGPANLALLLAAVAAAILFVRTERRVASPLVRLTMLGDPVLGPALAMSAIVTTVLMATLVVGPFYLARGLGLGAALVGLVMSIGPIVAAITGIPAGRLVNGLGAERMTLAGLAGVAGGCFLLAALPASAGVAGYILSMVLMTAGYALFQAANNTGVMSNVDAGHRGVVSALLNLSRNLGLITGASLMGAVFAFASGSNDIAAAPQQAVAFGMRTTFALATLLVLAALAVAVASRAAARQAVPLR